MGFASIGSFGSNQSAAANQASTTLTLSGGFSAAIGNLVVVIMAVDNFQTTDGDEGAVSTVTDSKGNTWIKALEWCNGQGAAQAGTTCSMWYSDITTAITSQNVDAITFNFTHNTSRDASACTGWIFSKGGNVAIEATNKLAEDGAVDPGSLDATTTNRECLRVRGISAETNSSTAVTPTTNWTAFTGNQTNSGAAAANQAVRGEFHISTGTTDASNPIEVLAAVDLSSVYVAFKSNQYSRTATESGSVSDAVARLLAAKRAPAESITAASDSVARTFVGARALSESGSVSDAVARLLALRRTLSEASAGSDAVTRTFVGARTASESGSVSDAVARVFVGSRAMSEASAGSDSVARVLASQRAVTESVSVSDAVARRITALRSLADTAPAPVDSVTRIFAGSRTAAEAVAAVDTASRVFIGTRTLGEAAAAPADVVARAFLGTRTLAEGVSVAEVVSRYFTGARSLNEAGGSASDAVTRLLASARALNEIIPLATDVVTYVYTPSSTAWVRSITELTGSAGDLLARGYTGNRSLTEALPAVVDGILRSFYGSRVVTLQVAAANDQVDQHRAMFRMVDEPGDDQIIVPMMLSDD